MLGADAHGKAEVEAAALARCRLFCDEWEQASSGGELAGAVAAGTVGRGDVTQLGDVLIGAAEGRSSAEEITLFDSTGLAIQDLAIAAAAYDAWRERPDRGGSRRAMSRTYLIAGPVEVATVLRTVASRAGRRRRSPRAGPSRTRGRAPRRAE